MPAAIATTFFSAEHSSTPRTSAPGNTIRRREPSTSRATSKTRGKVVATDVPAGSPCWILGGDVRPGEDADLAGARLLVEDGRHALVRNELEPFRAVHDELIGSEPLAGGDGDLAERLRRDDEEDDLGVGQRRA